MSKQLNIIPSPESPVDILEPPELFIDHMTLYHGSATPGISSFNIANEDTVGSGVYFVDNPKDAAGYATRRARRDPSLKAIVYSANVSGLKIVNLKNPEKLAEVMNGFEHVLQTKKSELVPDTPWHIVAAIDKSLAAIHSGIAVGGLRNATFSNGSLFSDYLSNIGYDGLKTVEGGEGNDIEAHDTYLIFDTSKAEVETDIK